MDPFLSLFISSTFISSLYIFHKNLTRILFSFKYFRIQISQATGQVVWYSHLLKNFPLFVVIHTVKGFGIVNKSKVDIFLELFCFFDNPMDVRNLISCSSAFSKSSLNIWKFSVHVLLKPGLENLEHYFATMWDECNCAIVWTFLALPFFGTGMKTDLFQSCGYWDRKISA